jgi:hypothetical protein
MIRKYWLYFSKFCLMFVAGINVASPVLAYEITADHFRNSFFRGFVIADVKYGVRTKEDLDALEKTGANLARVFIVLKRCEKCTKYDLPKGEIDTLDTLVKELAMRQIYTLPVFEPVDKLTSFWMSDSLQKSYTEHWKMLATRYRNVTSVAGFDLMNEPVPPGRTYADRQSTWLAYAEVLSREIRAIDPKRVLIIESAPDATPTSFETLKTLPLGNIVYSFHSYQPIALTHQGVMKDFPNPTTYGPYAAMDFNRQDLHKFLDTVAAFSHKHNVPILVGEFSCVRWAPQESALRYVSDSINYFESKGWSWIYNDFRAWPGWDAEIDSGDRTSTKRSLAAPVMNLLSDSFRRHLK